MPSTTAADADGQLPPIERDQKYRNKKWKRGGRVTPQDSLDNGGFEEGYDYRQTDIDQELLSDMNSNSNNGYTNPNNVYKSGSPEVPYAMPAIHSENRPHSGNRPYPDNRSSPDGGIYYVNSHKMAPLTSAHMHPQVNPSRHTPVNTSTHVMTLSADGDESPAESPATLATEV